MGKRSSFDRVERDFYPTPRAAVLPLVPHLPPGPAGYVELCAGDGALINHLADLAPNLVCKFASDIAPANPDFARLDFRDVKLEPGDLVITNPPWRRPELHALIDIVTAQGAVAWLLIDADWIHTRQSAAYTDRLFAMVSVGRVKWIPDSKMTGKDNAAWHFFVPNKRNAPTALFPRTAQC